MKQWIFHRISKLTLIVLAALLALSPCFAALAEDDEGETGEVLAPSYIVVDANDPAVVHYQREADVSRIPGSTMKIMTCILSLELCQDLDARVTVPGQAARMKETNSLMGVIAGEDLSVRELLYGLMLESGNDAAMTLAMHFGGGTVEGFAALMNAKAKEIGMSEVTHFYNASGAWKSGSGQFSTARDMAILACYAMKNETFRTIVATPTYTVPPNTVRKKPLTMTNGNRLVSDSPEAEDSLYNPRVNGVKTGSTELGGKCLAASAKLDGAEVVCIMLGAKEGGSKNQRMNRVFADAGRLMDLALETKYTALSLSELGLSYAGQAALSGGETIAVTGDFSGEGTVRLLPEKAAKLKTNPTAIVMEPHVDESLSSPGPGEPCGTLICRYEGVTVLTVPLLRGPEVQTADADPFQESPDPSPIETPEPTQAPSPAPTAVPTSSADHKALIIVFAAAAGMLSAAIVVLLIINAQRKKRRRKRRKKKVPR